MSSTLSLIDTHCHLHDPEFFTSEFAATALQSAIKNQVHKIIVIGTSHSDSITAQNFATKHTSSVFWSYGIHPQVADQPLPNHSEIQTLFSSHPPVAIGEVGLDYHYQPYDRDCQIRLFETMIDLAQKYNLPLIFHVREAFPDFFAVVDNFPGLRAVVHSFTDNKKHLKSALDRGFYIGVNGLATYSTLPTPPLDRILLETDAPFLTPVPFRGKINEPAYIRDIACWLSVKFQLPIDEVARITTQNANTLFNLSHPS